MTYASCSDLKWSYYDKHDIYLGVNNQLFISKHVDIVHARIEPDHTLTPHYHNRPQDGQEIFFFFAGGKLALIDKDGQETVYDEDSPFYLYFGSGPDEAHGIRNLGATDLEFAVICAPAFDPEEEVFV